MLRLRKPTPKQLRDLALCTLTGVLTFLSFPTALAPQLSFWPLIWVSHVPLLWVLKDKAPRSAFRYGFFTGLVINTGGYYWIADLLVTFGHLPRPVALIGLMLHSAYLALMWGLFAWLINRLTNLTPVPIQWSAPLAMVAVEAAVPRLFPAYMGNSQYLFLPMMQVVDLFGITAVTFLIYRVNAVLYLWLKARVEGRLRPLKATWATLAMLGLALVYGGVRIYQWDEAVEAAPKLKVGVVEGDVGIFERESRQRQADHLLIQQRLSAKVQAEGAELVVWSESAYRLWPLSRVERAFPPAQAPLTASALDDLRAKVSRADRTAPIRGFSRPLLFGSTSMEPLDQPRWRGDLPFVPYNTAFLLSKEGEVIGRYDKVYRLMFGEFVPFARHIPWFYDLVPAAGNLEAGTRVEAIEANLWPEKGPVRLGIIICYEGILPSFARQLAASHPHVLFNLTNDDWFGDTAERWLHLALVVPRAIEHRLTVVRSTLTGVSAVIDPVGRLVRTTASQGEDTFVEPVPLLQSATVYLLIGDAFPISCLLVVLGFLIRGWWRRR